MEKATKPLIPDTLQIFQKDCLSAPPLDNMKPLINKLGDLIEDSMKNLANDMLCQLCLGLAYEARKCKECHAIFCQEEIQAW